MGVVLKFLFRTRNKKIFGYIKKQQVLVRTWKRGRSWGGKREAWCVGCPCIPMGCQGPFLGHEVGWGVASLCGRCTMLPLLSELRREDAVRGPVTGPAASVEGQEAVSASVLEHSCCGRVRFYLSFLIGKMFIKS